MKNWKRIAGIILVIVFAYVYAHVAKTHEIYDKQIDSSEYIETGSLEEAAEYSFVSVEESIDALQVKCQLYDEVAGGRADIILIDNETGKEVARTELTTEEIRNGKFNEFSFGTIHGCKGKTYKVLLKSENVGFFCQDDGTLIMKTVTERFDVETFCVVLLLIAFIVGFFKSLYKLFSR